MYGSVVFAPMSREVSARLTARAAKMGTAAPDCSNDVQLSSWPPAVSTAASGAMVYMGICSGVNRARPHTLSWSLFGVGGL